MKYALSLTFVALSARGVDAIHEAGEASTTEATALIHKIQPLGVSTSCFGRGRPGR